MRSSLNSQGATRIWIYLNDSAKEIAQLLARERSSGETRKVDRLRNYRYLTNVLRLQLKRDYWYFVTDGSELWFESRNRFGNIRWEQVTSGEKYCEVIAALM